MMRICMVFGLLLLAAGCVTAPPGPPSLVGVWEMTELRIKRMSQCPPVFLTNKKDIYTADGIYHNTAAGSTKMTDVTTRTYKHENGVVTVFEEDGRKQWVVKVVFVSPTLIELHESGGEIVVFRKISDDPDKIPKLTEHIVPVKMQQASDPER